MKLNYLFFLGAFLCLCLSATSLTAQEEEQGQLWEVQALQIAPDKAMKFETMVNDIVQLAAAQKVSSDYRWHFWSEGFNYTVVNPVANFAAFDDPEAWMRQFGEEGGKKLGELFQRMEQEVGMHAGTREVIEQVPAWTYSPAEMKDFTYGTLYSFWVKPGQGEAFSELAGEFAKAWKDMKYPYLVSGYRTHMGDVGKVDFVVFYDDPAKFMGDNSFSKVAERAGHGDHYQKLLGKLTMHIDDMRISYMQYHPKMSYMGVPEASVSK